MQIVVDIPDEIIKSIENGSFGAKYNIYDLCGFIVNGTPLPKNHGRLIDADNLEKSLIDDNRQAFTKHQVWLMFSEYNKNVPTVLEAESEKR